MPPFRPTNIDLIIFRYIFSSNFRFGFFKALNFETILKELENLNRLKESPQFENIKISKDFSIRLIRNVKEK